MLGLPLPYMAVVTASPENVRRGAEILRGGGVVAFPTETVYGLGADALSAKACAAIFAIKRRPEFDPLIVHAGDARDLGGLAASVPKIAQDLAEAFWPGPLTLVLLKSPRVPDIVTAGLDTVAIRVPSHPVARALIAFSECPIAAPSANPFGYISPTSADHVERQIGRDVEWILDGGSCEHGIESTILDVSDGDPVLLRPGAVSLEAIEAVVGDVARPAFADGFPGAARSSTAPKAPGQLERHYSPRTEVTVLEGRAPKAPPDSRVGLLAFRSPDPSIEKSYAAVETLSPSGDLREAAANLFSAMHRLDALGLDRISAEPVPPAGLGLAIADRLRRASRRA